MEKWGFRFGKLVPKVKPKDQIKTWRIVTGDIVQVMDGHLAGNRGKVIEVRRRDNKVLIEGLNMIRKRVEGTVYNIEQGIQASKIALIDPEKQIPTKIRWGFVEDEKGGCFRKARISKLSGLEIPKPVPPNRERTTGPLDTSPEEAHKATFIPNLNIHPIPKGCIL